jgi:acetyl-CoA C-acetyltransferase
MTDIVILSAVRTAIGGFGGSLSTLAPSRLGAIVAREALARAALDPARIGTVVFGHVINTEPRDMYLSRVAAMEAGIPDSTPAMNVNRPVRVGRAGDRVGGAVLMLGDADFALAGGAECMSRAPYTLPAARFGQKMGDTTAVDMLTAR